MRDFHLWVLQGMLVILLVLCVAMLVMAPAAARATARAQKACEAEGGTVEHHRRMVRVAFTMQSRDDWKCIGRKVSP